MSASSLMEDLVEQILVRLPPEDPACLVRASLVCKPWRRLVAGPAFRRRYREFHRRPHLLGVLQILQGDEPYYSRFVPTSVFHVVDPVLPCWLVVDCRHGRALFATTNPRIEGTLGLVVWEPMMDDQRRVPQPSPEPEDYVDYAAAVLCAAEGCDHCGCEGGPFRVAFVSTDKGKGVTSARLYSSETGAWNDITSLHHPEANAHFAASVHVGDALYFRGIENYTIEYQLTTARLYVLEALAKCNGRLVTMEDGGLGFAAVDNTIITLWARETGSGAGGAEIWTQRRVIDLKTLLSGDALSHSINGIKYYSWIPVVSVVGFAEGTDTIFVGTVACVYMIELKSGRVRKVLDDFGRVCAYMSFYIPDMEVASTAEGPKECVLNL
ncbi:uncharacterized protein LOC125553701 [Triticum urartu]|uniref:F-box domain-containing protein n=1 Tax=Triticum urartu TaxID=4572 RepID=A0A8R7PED1_TRIUA|nr:uncharacterized protein LOC125541575 [Triticum urartu]XP_048573399.1 uncharacterized protein LOC125553701 [Triticum urartu]